MGSDLIAGARGPEESLVVASSHVEGWSRARFAYRRRLDHVSALFGEPLRVALAEPLEEQEEHASEAIHYYASAVDGLKAELRESRASEDNRRRERDTLHRALVQAVHELDRRTKKAGPGKLSAAAEALLENLHAIVAVPTEPF